MTVLQILAIITIAAASGLAALMTWVIVDRANRSGSAPKPESPAAPKAGPAPTAPPAPSPVTLAADPNMGVQLATLSKDLAALAESLAERENRLLMEIRAAALVKDPSVTDALRRIEIALGTLPAGDASEEGADNAEAVVGDAQAEDGILPAPEGQQSADAPGGGAQSGELAEGEVFMDSDRPADDSAQRLVSMLDAARDAVGKAEDDPLADLGSEDEAKPKRNIRRG